MVNPTLQTLQQASRDLLYPSEQDKPIKAFLWPKSEIGKDTMDAEALKKQAHLPDGAKVESQTIEAFFAPVTEAQDWYGEEEKATLKRFQKLSEAVKQNLADVKVYRIGNTDKAVYVVGKTSEGDFAGVVTTVVET